MTLKIINITLLLSITIGWELTLFISDINDVASDDFIILGTCESCHDGFHFGEDVPDIPTPPTDYTNIQFYNFDWIGDIDSNGNLCSSPSFSIDRKSIHPSSELIQWNIRGSVSGHESPLEFTWTWDIDENIDDYDIYLHIGEESYDLKELDNIILNPEDLYPIYENINGDWISYDNIKIFVGGCASTGPITYYQDLDQDGWGAGAGYDYCPGLEPPNFVINNLDLNDLIYCEINEFDDCGICNGNNTDQDCQGVCFGNAELDDCGICNGNNTDQDCQGVCFGNAELDDCGICNGENQSCLDIIFEYVPYNLYALIEENLILVSWDFDIDLEDSFIEGFRIYYNENNPTIIGTTQNLYFETAEFNNGYFCISAFDRFENESNILCAEASEYNSFSYNLHEGANLLSFPYIPEDNSLDNIFYPIRNEIEGIIGEGIAAQYEESIDSFIGSLNAIYHKNGYWVKIKPGLGNINFNILGFPYEEDSIEYELHEGYNLISYLGSNNLSIEEAIPNELLNNIISIIGEGTASVQIQGEWVGNLNYLKYGTGYWIKSNSSNALFYWATP